MTLAEALDRIVADTGHERYRWLCSEDNPDVGQREGYRQIVMEHAGQPRDPAAEAIATVRQSGVTETPKRGCCG